MQRLSTADIIGVDQTQHSFGGTLPHDHGSFVGNSHAACRRTDMAVVDVQTVVGSDFHTMTEQASPIRTGAICQIACPITPAEVLDRLDAVARRGKLPGYHPGSTAAGSPLFEITDFGAPFEARLIAAAHPSAAGTDLSFEAPRLKPLFPWIFGLILILTVWPGGWLTDSMIRSYWEWYSSTPWWSTYVWYLPLTVPFCPMAMHSALRKSRTSAAAEVPAILTKIAAATGGQISPSRD